VIQTNTPDDRAARKEFAVAILEKLDEDKEFLKKIMFSGELLSTSQGR
jgi:hypothetical protein